MKKYEVSHLYDMRNGGRAVADCAQRYMLSQVILEELAAANIRDDIPLVNYERLCARLSIPMRCK